MRQDEPIGGVTQASLAQAADRSEEIKKIIVENRQDILLGRLADELITKAIDYAEDMSLVELEDDADEQQDHFSVKMRVVMRGFLDTAFQYGYQQKTMEMGKDRTSEGAVPVNEIKCGQCGKYVLRSNIEQEVCEGHG